MVPGRLSQLVSQEVTDALGDATHGWVTWGVDVGCGVALEPDAEPRSSCEASLSFERRCPQVNFTDARLALLTADAAVSFSQHTADAAGGTW